MPVILKQGEQGDNAALVVQTRSRKLIKNEQVPESDPSSLQAGVRDLRGTHPAARLRSVTAIYNCAGLVFASRRTYIDADQIAFILQEDGYALVRPPNEPQVGDLVIYERVGLVQHVGIIMAPSEVGTFQVMSKWGEFGEYLHAINDVPVMYGTPTQFWTDRRSVADAG